MSRTEMFAEWISGNLVIASTLFTTGKYFFVDSTHTLAADEGGAGITPDHPCATIDYAVGLCTANRGDVIVVAPGHTENLAADSAVDVDVAGVTIFGIRKGRLMPTLTATVIAGDFKLAAANCTVQNIRFLGGVDATTGVIEISAADCAVLDCEYRDATDQATNVLITTAAANRLLIDGFRLLGAHATGSNAGFMFIGADDLEVRNCYISGSFAKGPINFLTTVSLRVWVHDCTLQNIHTDDKGVFDEVTASTGWIGPNMEVRVDADAANFDDAFDGATFQYSSTNGVVNKVNERTGAMTQSASTHA